MSKPMQDYEAEAEQQLKARTEQEQAKLVQCRYGSGLYFSCPFDMGLSSFPCGHCIRPEALRDREQYPEME